MQSFVVLWCVKACDRSAFCMTLDNASYKKRNSVTVFSTLYNYKNGIQYL